MDVLTHAGFQVLSSCYYNSPKMNQRRIGVDCYPQLRRIGVDCYPELLTNTEMFKSTSFWQLYNYWRPRNEVELSDVIFRPS